VGADRPAPGRRRAGRGRGLGRLPVADRRPLLRRPLRRAPWQGLPAAHGRRVPVPIVGRGCGRRPGSGRGAGGPLPGGVRAGHPDLRSGGDRRQGADHPRRAGRSQQLHLPARRSADRAGAGRAAPTGRLASGVPGAPARPRLRAGRPDRGRGRRRPAGQPGRPGREAAPGGAPGRPRPGAAAEHRRRLAAGARPPLPGRAGPDVHDAAGRRGHVLRDAQLPREHRQQHVRRHHGHPLAQRHPIRPRGRADR
jgi:translation initiation factor IF-2